MDSEVDCPRIDLKGEFETLTLMVSRDTGWLYLYDADASVMLTQKDVKALLPHLQAFAEKGNLEQKESEEN